MAKKEKEISITKKITLPPKGTTTASASDSKLTNVTILNWTAVMFQLLDDIGENTRTIIKMLETKRGKSK